MIIDLENTQLPHETRYHVCIVGAGAAGILISLQLARANFSVVMLEGGGRTPEARSDAIYDASSIGHAYPGLSEGRRRIFGGSTTAWGGQILPLMPIDFAKRDWVPGSGWPIQGESLSPFYERALAFEGLSAAIHSDNAVWREIGILPGRCSQDFEGYFSRWCPEPSFARIYGAEIEACTNLHAALHANVTKIEANPENGHINGVVCRGYDGSETKVTADYYVFCLGGLETNRLMLQPMRGDARAPWAASGYVGKHYQDHLGVTIGHLRPGQYGHIGPIFDNYYKKRIKYHPRIRPTEAFQTKHHTLGAVAYLVQKSKSTEHLLAAKRILRGLRQGNLGAIISRDVASAAGGTIHLAKQAVRMATKARAYNPDDLGTRVDLSCEQLPLGSSAITLSGDKDALGMHRINIQWKIDPVEITTVQKMATALASLFKANGWPEITLDPDLINDPLAFSAKVFDYYHHMSGLRMADDPAHGVVDANLKLHGTLNGYVCSAAVFPTSGFSNPTHTVLALGMRLSDTLAKNILSNH